MEHTTKEPWIFLSAVLIRVSLKKSVFLLDNFFLYQKEIQIQRIFSNGGIKCNLWSLVFILTMVFTCVSAVWGQDIEWIRQFGYRGSVSDRAEAVDVDPYGNVYVAGYTEGELPGQTSAGYDDAFVRKYDTEGNEIWTQQFGTGSYAYAYDIIADSSGVYVAGYIVGALPGQTQVSTIDAFVRKYDLNGNEIWTQQFGTGSHDRAYGITADSSRVYFDSDREEFCRCRNMLSFTPINLQV